MTEIITIALKTINVLLGGLMAYGLISGECKAPMVAQAIFMGFFLANAWYL
mgnify:CR=1 FL=1